MADKEVTILPGTRIDTLRVVVESGVKEDGTKWEKQQATAPRTFEEAITDKKRVALSVKLSKKADEIVYNEETEKLELRANGVVISETEIPAGGGGTMYATINVATEEPELFEQPVTCSIAGGETLQSVFSETGAATFKAKFIGQYEIVCGDASNTVDVTMLGAIYNVELSAIPRSTIIVTTQEEDLYNKAVTCTDGEESLESIFNSSGQCTFTVHNIAEYIISCEVYSTKVNVTDFWEDYSATISINSKIHVTTPDAEMYGAHLKLTKPNNGGDINAALDENGEYTFVVDALGSYLLTTESQSWTIYVQEYGKTYEREVYAIYTFMDKMDVLDPTQKIRYIGLLEDYTPMVMDMATHVMDYGSFANCSILKDNRPAMVKYDGTVDYWLDPEDYSKKLDGTPSDITDLNYEGNAFAWLPKIYKQEYDLGNGWRAVSMSRHKISDKYLPNGFIDPDGNELDGVWLPMYYSTLDSSGRARSMAVGQPTTRTTADAQKAAIDKNGERYAFLGGPIMSTIADLLIMFVKNTNSQASYGSGNCNGYVSANYEIISNAVVPGGQFYGSADGKSLNKIFHSVVLATQNVWIRDPYTLTVNGTYKVSKNYNYDITGATYDDVGSAPNTNDSFIKKLKVVEGYGSLPDVIGASSLTGYCDNYWVNTSGTMVSVRLADCGCGSRGGLFAFSVDNPASHTGVTIASALLLLPKPQEPEQEETL